MIRGFALVFGIAFIAFGILGFMPAFVTDGKLLGIFAIDSMHNAVHLISGVVALLSAIRSDLARWYFRIFGIVYGLVAAAGFIYGDNILGMQMNMADHILHTVIAVISLYLGFIYRRPVPLP